MSASPIQPLRAYHPFAKGFFGCLGCGVAVIFIAGALVFVAACYFVASNDLRVKVEQQRDAAAENQPPPPARR